MKKLMLLVMLLLTVCSSAFAESIDDVLKDCKLDRNHWKVVEWSKADHFVRFYFQTLPHRKVGIQYCQRHRNIAFLFFEGCKSGNGGCL